MINARNRQGFKNARKFGRRVLCNFKYPSTGTKLSSNIAAFKCRIMLKASPEDIRQAFKRLSILYHPDKHTDIERKKSAEVIFQKINRAYSGIRLLELLKTYQATHLASSPDQSRKSKAI